AGLFEAKREWMPRLLDLDVAAAMEVAEEIIRWVDRASAERSETKSGVEMNANRRRFHGLVLGQMMAFYRDALVLTAGAADVPLVHEDQRGEVERLAGRLDQRTAGRAIAVLQKSQRFLDQNVHITLTIENALIQLSRLAVRPKPAVLR
ncbi:MAG: DNA polymerase III subunit delta' C-terminal domain-containing protein, partial [Phycisphaerae bacterium]|nr:DNA polymerase III subunit delta' C-terminal domain-containing protein [Phycisphaerae bacterium]